MKIGVVADTHSLDIPRQMLNDFKKVDMIIHAGDFCTIKELEVFQKITKVKAVVGNMDDADLRDVLPQRQIFKCEEFMIGLVHSYGPPKDTLNNAIREFRSSKVDIVIFGHSHIPCNETINKVLYFNPGSPNDQILAPYCSYGIIDIKDKQIFPKIVKVKK